LKVYLWPDNDDKGRDHMEGNGRRLIELGARELFIITWPDAPPKGDAADFEGDVEALLDSAEPFELEPRAQGQADDDSEEPFEVSEFTPPAVYDRGLPAAESKAQLPAAPSGLVTLNVEELLRCQTEPREFVIEPILREKDLAMIYSWRGVGKTLVALDMAYAIASGGKCLKWEAPRPRRVLYIDGELPLQTIKERVARLAAANDKEPPAPDYLQFITPDVQERPIPNLADPKAQAMVDQIIADQKIEVVFIDSISTLCSAGRENEAESWLPIQEWALRLRRRGVAIVFVHHAGKGGAQRGTSRREDILDTVIHLVHPSDYRPEEGSRFEVHFEKTRALWGESLRPFEAKLEAIDGTAAWTMRDVEDLNKNRALELFGEGMSIRDVAEALGISRSAAARLKTRLTKETKADGKNGTVPLSHS
jgi:putative DNA primase/helicase